MIKNIEDTNLKHWWFDMILLGIDLEILEYNNQFWILLEVVDINLVLKRTGALYALPIKQGVDFI